MHIEKKQIIVLQILTKKHIKDCQVLKLLFSKRTSWKNIAPVCHEIWSLP